MKEIQYRELHTDKGLVCSEILRTLPRWFGIEEAIVDYVKAVENMAVFIAEHKGEPVGFIGINRHFELSAEIHVMGIKPDFHRMGIGKRLVQIAEHDLREKGVKFFLVKTLSPKRENAEYALTRKFYQSMGFLLLQELPELWGPENPCLDQIKLL